METDNTKPVVAANPATQTLFRFTSLRNPQLAEAKNNDNFIVRNFLTTGYFDQLIQEWYAPPAKGISKLDYLAQKINENTEVFTIKKNEKDLKLVLGYFYTAGKELSQKRDWENMTDVEILIDEIESKIAVENSTESKLLSPTTSQTKTLWDSLIYQMLTQENFYLKEIIIQSLQAINYYQQYQSIRIEPLEKKAMRHQKVASAKVVIPDYLFIDSAIPQDENRPFTVNETEIGGSYIYEMDELNQMALPKPANQEISELNDGHRFEKMELAIAAHKRDQLELLRKEIKKIEKTYQKSFIKSHNVASKEYQDMVNPMLREYENAISEAESTFTPETTEAQKTETLGLIETPVIPEFTFDKEPERNLEVFAQKLSEKSLGVFVDLFATTEETLEVQGKISAGELQEKNVLTIEDRSVVFPAEENVTFNEIFETIDENLSEVNENLRAKSSMQKEQFVKLGSVLIPVNKSEETAFAYSLMAKKTLISSGFRVTMAKWDYFLSLNLPDSTWNIASLNYTILTTNGITKTGTSYSFTRTDGDIFIANLFASNYIIAKEDYPVNFEMEIIFTNGESTKITLDRQIIADLLYTGIFRLESDLDDTDTQNNVFVPNGFGIKRLGVADYMKVEQTTHAYVEGEVANIENIMAREYRNKSTRRFRKNEVTESSSTETEREKLTDTTTVNRHEMQTEVSKLLQEEKNKEGHASAGKRDKWFFEVGGSFANRTSKETATRQAMSKSQDVTARALDRIVSKVKQERVEKIIEEFEENNSHGFDNRKGDKHVVGVYRWVDKVMKNQIYNYGKRMMLEFMIPQPAKLHELAHGNVPNTTTYEKPKDPRTDAAQPMVDAASATEGIIQNWANYYKVELTELPSRRIEHHIPYEWFKLEGSNEQRFKTLDIPEKYAAKKVTTFYGYEYGAMKVSDFKGGDMMLPYVGRGSIDSNYTVSDLNITTSFNFKYQGFGVDSFNVTFNLECELSDAFLLSWKQEQFTKIIAAYDVALKEWEEKMAAIKEEGEKEKAKDENTQYYRQIEEVLLKHNCIAYLLQSYAKLGTKLYEAKGNEMKNFKVLLGKDLNDYTALAKFMEQAFEWEIMDYTFYPYYWGNKEDWKKMFLEERIDPLFRSFLQAGMGRVIVTVKPGFEDAINFYLATGKIWNGGEVPVIGDPLYLSIVDELREPQGEMYGKPWVTRLPTSLTILQAESIGLQVEHALPFTKEDPSKFENPSEVITEKNFNFIHTDAAMQSPDSKEVGNIEINNDFLQLTTKEDPKQVVSQISLDDLKVALE